MKIRILNLILIAFPLALSAQKKHEATDRIHSFNWDIIAGVKFDMDEDFNFTPIFPETIKRFRDRSFELTGYMIPIKPGRSHQRFLLSALPINQCYYCGQNGIPAMVLIIATKPITFSEKPVKLIGRLKLDSKKGEAPVTLYDAKIKS
jgi:hypothetical protein